MNVLYVLLNSLDVTSYFDSMVPYQLILFHPLDALIVASFSKKKSSQGMSTPYLGRYILRYRIYGVPLVVSTKEYLSNSYLIM